jgi:hypothetical protein
VQSDVSTDASADVPPDLTKPRYYSLAGFNSDGSHFVSKYHKAGEHRVVGAEDLPLASSDRDYNDVLVLVSANPVEQRMDCSKPTFMVANGDLDNNSRDQSLRLLGHPGWHHHDLPA